MSHTDRLALRLHYPQAMISRPEAPASFQRRREWREMAVEGTGMHELSPVAFNIIGSDSSLASGPGVVNRTWQHRLQNLSLTRLTVSAIDPSLKTKL